MNTNINESIKFLFSEYNRLKLKEKNNIITKEEKNTLKKLEFFIGKKMINTIKKTYDDFVANNFINYDQKQIDLIEKIETTWQQSKRINFFSNTKKFKGIYVHGDVGIGKTFIINLFIQNIENAKKIHFNHLMIDLHAFINTNKKKRKCFRDFYKKFYKKN